MGRAATAVDAVAERYLDAFAALDPCAATELGITGHDEEVTDYSTAGVTARAQAATTALRELDQVDAVDDVDTVTAAAMRERLGVLVELHDAGLDVGDLNVIASPLQSMRDVFDLMATDTDDDSAARGDLMAALACPFADGGALGAIDRRAGGPNTAASARSSCSPSSGHPRLQFGAQFLGVLLRQVDLIADTV